MQLTVIRASLIFQTRLPDVVEQFQRQIQYSLNQRTNGPVNAHLISGSPVSTKQIK